MKVVAYYRVSTRQQSDSGLGIEGQISSIHDFVKKNKAKLIASYTEVESGTKSDRSEIKKAIAHAKRAQATLVVAKLDRLSRNVAFLSGLMESGVEFVACDNPNANRLTIHILAAVAEEEARVISERTKSALRAYKARGGKLGAHIPGSRRFTPEETALGCARAAVSVTAKADEAYADIFERVIEWRQAGATYWQMADRLNEEGHTTRWGKSWTAPQARRVLIRATRRGKNG